MEILSKLADKRATADKQTAFVNRMVEIARKNDRGLVPDEQKKPLAQQGKKGLFNSLI